VPEEKSYVMMKLKLRQKKPLSDMSLKTASLRLLTEQILYTLTIP
jgi:hypothetical protein